MLIEVTAPEGYEVVGYGQLRQGEFYLSIDGKAYEYKNILGQSTPFYGIKVVRLRRLSELKRGDKFSTAIDGDVFQMIGHGGHIVKWHDGEPARTYRFLSDTFRICSTNEDMVVYPVS